MNNKILIGCIFLVFFLYVILDLDTTRISKMCNTYGWCAEGHCYERNLISGKKVWFSDDHESAMKEVICFNVTNRFDLSKRGWSDITFKRLCGGWIRLNESNEIC